MPINTPLFRLKVMVVDDELDFLEDFKIAVKPYGHLVTGLAEPQEAMKVVQEAYNQHNPFDAIFIDYLMPNMNGISLAERVKKIDPDLILIALTRDGSIETRVLITRSGAFDLFLLKSCKIDKFQKLFSILASTKIEQYSGHQTRLSRKLLRERSLLNDDIL